MVDTRQGTTTLVPVVPVPATNGPVECTQIDTIRTEPHGAKHACPCPYSSIRCGCKQHVLCVVRPTTIIASAPNQPKPSFSSTYITPSQLPTPLYSAALPPPSPKPPCDNRSCGNPGPPRRSPNHNHNQAASRRRIRIGAAGGRIDRWLFAGQIGRTGGRAGACLVVFTSSPPPQNRSPSELRES